VGRKLTALLVAVAALLSTAHATTYAGRWGSFTVSIAYPVVWFEDPQYPNVEVSLYNYKTRALVDVYAKNLGLRLVERRGYVFDLRQGPDYVFQYFEPYGKGCDYYFTDDGAGIQVTGNPAGGIYGGCTLRYKYPPGSLGNISVAALLKTDDTGTNYGIRGVSLWNSATGYYYLAGLKNNRTGWFFGIYKYTGRTVREPGGPSLPALVETLVTGVVGFWFHITLLYATYPDGSVVVKAWLYNVTGGGGLVAYLYREDASPIYPDNFGLTVYQIVNKPSAVFQLMSFTTEVYVIIVRGLSYCCWVYVYDSAGQLVGSAHVNETGTAVVELANPVARNAVVRVICDGYEYTYEQDLLLGGDLYEAYYWFEGPVLAVYTSILDARFTGWLRVHGASCTGPIYSIEVWLANQTATSTRATITQVDGDLLVYPDETSPLVFTPQPTGWVGNVTLRAELYRGTYCTLHISFLFSYTSAAIGSLKATVNIAGG